MLWPCTYIIIYISSVWFVLMLLHVGVWLCVCESYTCECKVYISVKMQSQLEIKQRNGNIEWSNVKGEMNCYFDSLHIDDFFHHKP